MRKLRYAVAMSLDGYIAGPNGEYDWIDADPELDFNAIWSQFDTLLMGRRTFELAVRARGEDAFTAFTGITSIVFSRTLKPQEHPKCDSPAGIECRLGKRPESSKRKGHLAVRWWQPVPLLFRRWPGRWRRGCCRTGLAGRGDSITSPPYSPAKLRLIRHHVYRSGRVSLTYEVER
jgi:RibD C-terminal domain